MSLLDVAQAADLAGVSRVTVRSWVRNGHLKALVLGRVYVIESADLARLMADPPRPGRPRKIKP